MFRILCPWRMPPRRNAANNNNNAEMAALIAQQMAAVIPNLVAQIHNAIPNNNLNAQPQGNNNGGNPPICSYKHFNSCNPQKFHGTEGATGLLQWFESMESTFVNSDCPDNLKVRHATSLLFNRALTWWNGE